MECITCTQVLGGKQEKYCSKPCETKGWQVKNRERYLLSKKLYREKHKEQILAYNRKVRSNEIPKRIRRKTTLKRMFCERCGIEEKLNVHHIKPVSKGGNHLQKNLLLLCWDCHMLWHKHMKGYWI